ncbi:MAG: hypothetical protein ACPIOQ_53630 [Promethearchaeia archaeon]
MLRAGERAGAAAASGRGADGPFSISPSYWLPDQYVLEPLDRDMTTSRGPPHPAAVVQPLEPCRNS